MNHEGYAGVIIPDLAAEFAPIPGHPPDHRPLPFARVTDYAVLVWRRPNFGKVGEPPES